MRERLPFGKSQILTHRIFPRAFPERFSTHSPTRWGIRKMKRRAAEDKLVAVARLGWHFCVACFWARN